MPPNRRTSRLIGFPHPQGGVEQRESPRQAATPGRIRKSGGLRHAVQAPVCAARPRLAAERPCLLNSPSHFVPRFPLALFETDLAFSTDVRTSVEIADLFCSPSR